VVTGSDAVSSRWFRVSRTRWPAAKRKDHGRARGRAQPPRKRLISSWF